MVVGRERSEMARRRTLRDLLSVGGIVGCVALGVAVIVAPATSNLRSIVPEGAPITAPDLAPRVGDVAVEVRPGAAQRRAAVTSLAPGELVLAPPPLDRGAGLTSVRSPLSPELLASASQPALLEAATPLPIEPAPAPVAVAPVVVEPAEALTAQSVEATRPGKAKGKAKGLASSPASSKRKPSGQVQTTSSMHAAASDVSSEDGGTRGHGPKSGSDRPRGQHPGRAPEHAAAHQRR